MSDRETLIARIRNLRRAAPARDVHPPEPGNAEAGRMDMMERRIAHLEQLVEGLQDSVHRQATRQGKRITDLETQIQPAALGAALRKDARERGL